MRRIIIGAVTAILLVAGASQARALTTEAMLDSVQYSAFRYFWYEANPANGLVKDRSSANPPASIAAVGFGLSAYCVGVDHGWITRQQAVDRVRTTLNTFWTGPQGSGASGVIGYKGLFYHFLDINTATRFQAWGADAIELSTIDTALLMAGILDVKQYFTGADTAETRIRALADSIYYRADWDWARNGQLGIMMGWKPSNGFADFGQWVGYNEAMILYILAIGSPTHPTPNTAWGKWTSGYLWGTQYGYTYLIFPPLFGHQYSHCWVDFRTIADYYMRGRGITYFQNSRYATLAQRAYSIANPGGWLGYSDILWGITASDVQGGYLARGAPPPENDNGTIAPTAPAASIAFAPDEVIPVLHNMYDNYPLLWGPYGFRDAFKPATGWYDTDYLGIDQGPIVMMIENFRNHAIWDRFMLNADIQRGLTAAGFRTVTGLAVGPGLPARPGLALASSPNPFRASTTLRFQLPQAGHVRLAAYDLQGREVARLVDGEQPAGEHEAVLRGEGLGSGIYYYRLEANGATLTQKGVRLR